MVRAWLLTLLLLAGGCLRTPSPTLRVLGVQQTLGPTDKTLFVEVTNGARRVMRLKRFEYQLQAGEPMQTLTVQRDVPAGGTVVLQLPVFVQDPSQMTLRGRLITQLDSIDASYNVQAAVE